MTDIFPQLVIFKLNPHASPVKCGSVAHIKSSLWDIGIKFSILLMTNVRPVEVTAGPEALEHRYNDAAPGIDLDALIEGLERRATFHRPREAARDCGVSLIAVIGHPTMPKAAEYIIVQYPRRISTTEILERLEIFNKLHFEQPKTPFTCECSRQESRQNRKDLKTALKCIQEHRINGRPLTLVLTDQRKPQTEKSESIELISLPALPEEHWAAFKHLPRAKEPCVLEAAVDAAQLFLSAFGVKENIRLDTKQTAACSGTLRRIFAAVFSQKSLLQPGLYKYFVAHELRHAPQKSKNVRLRTLEGARTASRIIERSYGPLSRVGSHEPIGLLRGLFRCGTAENIVKAAIMTSLLSGCSSLTGLVDAADDFSCPRTGDGMPCSSLSTTFEAHEAGQLPHQIAERNSTQASEAWMEPQLAQEPAARPVPSKAPHSESAFRPVAAESGTTNLQAQTSGDLSKDAASPSAAPDEVQTLLDRMDAQIKAFEKLSSTASVSQPQRRPERILTLYVAPWTDAEGDLHEGHQMHIRLAAASWSNTRAAVIEEPALTAAPLKGTRSDAPAALLLPPAEDADRDNAAVDSSDAPVQDPSEELRKLRGEFAKQLKALHKRDSSTQNFAKTPSADNSRSETSALQP